MFTGIVEKVRVVRRREAGRFLLEVGSLARQVRIGGSLAVNGVCLTAVSREGGVLAFDLSDETRRRTTLGSLKPGQWVNVERPLKVGQDLGGHLIQGHVDGVGCVLAVHAHDRGASMRIAVSRELRKWLVARGSVAVDGASLTVAELGRATRRDATLLRYHQKALKDSGGPVPEMALLAMLDWFSVNLIPHTLHASSLGDLKEGDLVNLEADVMIKWLAELQRTGSGRDPFAGKLPS